MGTSMYKSSNLPGAVVGESTTLENIIFSTSCSNCISLPSTSWIARSTSRFILMYSFRSCFSSSSTALTSFTDKPDILVFHPLLLTPNVVTIFPTLRVLSQVGTLIVFVL
uniref:Uncharacterized protein n=1 Tax=Cacopsylla melanoneura TaxID=428564 RepID=A0A8D8TYA5_9HEMI